MADGTRPALPADWTSLKAEIKAEVQRRNQSGSVASYGGTDYDYTAAPAPDTPIRGEHVQKVLEPMQAINPDGLPEYPGELTEDGIEAMETKVAAWKTRSMTDRSASDCQTGCTGTCHTACSTGCYTGCSTSCSGCSGCSGCGGCDGGCWAYCSTACQECTGTCKDECKGSCTGGCQGCDGGCQGTCVAGCANIGCIAECASWCSKTTT